MPSMNETFRMRMAVKNGWLHNKGIAVSGAFTRQDIASKMETTRERPRPKESLPTLRRAYEARYGVSPLPGTARNARGPAKSSPAASAKRAVLSPLTARPAATPAVLASPSRLMTAALATARSVKPPGTTEFSSGLNGKQKGGALPPLAPAVAAAPASKRYTDRVCCAGTGVGSKPDKAFFEQKRALWEKKIKFKYGDGDNPLAWAGTTAKFDPPAEIEIDYKAQCGQIASERVANKKQAQKNSRSSLVLGDEKYKDAYWTSGADLFSGRVGGVEIAEQRKRNAKIAKIASGSTVVLGSDADYF
jgi:hypothetical protein